MTLDAIKAAVAAGKTVHWKSSSYTVELDSAGQWLIHCAFNGHCVGLTWRDGITMNGEPGDFYLGGEP